jgi:hypothetical protein
MKANEKYSPSRCTNGMVAATWHPGEEFPDSLIGNEWKFMSTFSRFESSDHQRQRASHFQKGGQKNGLHYSIRSCHDDGGDSGQAGGSHGRASNSADRARFGMCASAPELGRGHRQQRQSTTANAMDYLSRRSLMPVQVFRPAIL